MRCRHDVRGCGIEHAVVRGDHRGDVATRAVARAAHRREAGDGDRSPALVGHHLGPRRMMRCDDFHLVQEMRFERLVAKFETDHTIGVRAHAERIEVAMLQQRGWLTTPDVPAPPAATPPAEQTK